MYILLRHKNIRNIHYIHDMHYKRFISCKGRNHEYLLHYILYYILNRILHYVAFCINSIISCIILHYMSLSKTKIRVDRIVKFVRVFQCCLHFLDVHQAHELIRCGPPLPNALLRPLREQPHLREQQNLAVPQGDGLSPGKIKVPWINIIYYMLSIYNIYIINYSIY